MRMRLLGCVVAVGVMVCAVAAGAQREVGWAEYGGTLEGQRYSKARQIDRESVGRLRQVWSVPLKKIEGPKTRGMFEATPVLWRGTLYFDTPLNVLVAVDAATGRVRWIFDPKVDPNKVKYIVTSRGVALWHDASRHGGACADRVLMATLDRRLMAVDARDGRVCAGFGDGGTVDLARGLYVSDPAMLEFTSAPVVVGDRAVVGSSVGDNTAVDTPAGAVRGFDVRTGREVWSWEPLPWVQGPAPHNSGAGNAWAPLAADAEHDLVFVPTSSPSVDYYGGTRVGDDRDADSIVALRASTGEKVWAFQLVHHNLWDYDTASQPLLFTWRGDGHGSVPAVAVMNKTGMIYVFNRLTGEPLFPIEERAVPESDVPGEQAWPTQPFSSVQPLLSMDFRVDKMAGGEEDERFCEELMKEVRYDGPFTPPSMKGAVVYPASLGGPNWGSSAFDPATGVMYTRVNSMAFLVWLSRQGEDHADASAEGPREELMSPRFQPPDSSLAYLGRADQKGTPYTLALRALVGPKGAPCGEAPYGRLVATDLNSGRQLWSVAHGRMQGGGLGSIGMSGPIATAGGLVFVAASDDAMLRAYDAATGKELWKGVLPARGTGTPMTYVVRGRQYVVVATGDEPPHELVAFAVR
jgi:quinoprotein glucose dehydrogenase